MKQSYLYHVLATVPAIVLGTNSLLAQATSTEQQVRNEQLAEEEVILSPFMVDASEGREGYQATTTLAGSRVRTDVRDLGTSITIVTKKLMSDIGAVNNETLLQYTTNTEVGGMRGNFSGLGNASVLGESSQLLRPNTNTRVRGLDSADNTRDYFLTEIPWDGYNIDRVELQRGPNSILFGLGSPAGIINTSLSGASYKNANRVENKVGPHGSLRNLLDINYSILKNELAVRVMALDDNTKYQQKPAFNHAQRLYGTLRFDPKLLKFEGASTNIRANFERGDIKANRPRMLPPVDGITPFFTILNKKTYDPAVEDATGGLLAGGSSGPISAALTGYLGGSFAQGLALRYDGSNPTPTSYTVGTIRVDPNQGVTNGGSIGGLPFYRSCATTNYASWATQAGTLPGGSTGFYKDKSLTDRSVFDYYNKLLDGDTKREWQNWQSYNVALSQVFLNNRLGFEGVIDHQRYKDGQEALLGGSTTLVVDTNSTVISGLTTKGGTANPNAGRVTTAGSVPGCQQNDIERDSKRLTATGELRSSDFMDKGFFQKLLGKHVFTGLLEQDTKETFARQYSLFAGGIGPGSLVHALNDPSQKVNDVGRVISIIDYLSGDLRTQSSPSGANVRQFSSNIIPHHGTTSATYFDTHWTASGVDPKASWSNPLQPTQTFTQADNPANYKGWTSLPVTVLNAREGDLDALTYSTSRNYNRVRSKAFTYQAFLWDESLVGTFGYRRDDVMQKSGFGTQDPISGVAPTNFDYNPSSILNNGGNSKSWSFVVHTPKSLRAKLPGNTDISFFYNRSQNFKADVVRGDFMGNLLPNQTGTTKDYGVVITTLKDKLSLKINWYKTIEKNASLGGESLLGGSAWYLRQGEIWGTMVAAQSIAGLTQPKIATPSWAWDYAANDLGLWLGDTAIADRPAAAKAIDAKQLASARAFLQGMMPQKFWDEYGYAVNASQIKSENFTSLLASDGHLHYTWDWQPAYGGNLKSTGSGPVVTVDTESRGVEYELAAQPTKNWNLALNASKTNATRKNLSATVENYILSSKVKYDGVAGDLRLWGPGDTTGTLRNNWNRSVYYPYLFLKSSEGSQAAEVRPWRFNLMTSYNFSEGAIKGSYVGIAHRWMQSEILGYGMKQTATGDYNLDVNKPYRGKSEAATDLWIGYSHKLSKWVDWRIQLNLTNVGEKNRLVPISVQPDGSPASYRIAEGMGWSLTNTFNF